MKLILPTRSSQLAGNIHLSLLFHLLCSYAAMADYLTNLTIANLTALFLQSILYGIYITTCGDCARALTRVNGRWKSRQEMQWPFLLAGGLLLINTTCSLSIELQRCIDLLVYKGPIQSVWIIVVKVRYAIQCYQTHILIILLIISPLSSFSKPLWETSFSSTEFSWCTGGIG